MGRKKIYQETNETNTTIMNTPEEVKEEQSDINIYGETGVGVGLAFQRFNPAYAIAFNTNIYSKAGLQFNNRWDAYLKAQFAINPVIYQNRLFIEYPKSLDYILGLGCQYERNHWAVCLDIDFGFKNVRWIELNIFSMMGFTVKPSYTFNLSNNKTEISIGLPIQILKNKTGHQIGCGISAGVRY